MKYARIQNGEVMEVLSENPAGRFHPSITFVEVDDTVQVGDLRVEDGSFRSPDYVALVTGRVADETRMQRDRLLAESDKMVLADRWAAMSKAERKAWSDYRQALRDLPDQSGFPQSIVWPFKPGVPQTKIETFP